MVLVQGQRIPFKCLSMTDSGEAGRLWLCPLNSHMLCSRTSNQVPRDVTSWRGDTGALRTLHLSQDLPSPEHVPSRVQCGKEKADFRCLQGYRPQTWGRLGEQAVIWVCTGALPGFPSSSPSEGGNGFSSWGFYLRWLSAWAGSVHFWTSFFITTLFLCSSASHTREGRPRMTVPKVICGIF